MTVIDYVILAIVLVSAIAGLMRGFLREICSLITWILAVWFAWHFGATLEPYLGGELADPPYSTWAGRVIVFLIVLFAGTAIGALISHLVRLSLFSGMDRFLGFALGAVRGLVVLGLIAIVAQSARLDQERWWKHSRLVPYVQGVASGLRAIAGDRIAHKPLADL
jgi:membrane protein required for colicin V production